MHFWIFWNTLCCANRLNTIHTRLNDKQIIYVHTYIEQCLNLKYVCVIGINLKLGRKEQYSGYIAYKSLIPIFKPGARRPAASTCLVS